MNIYKIAYWASTGIMCFIFAGSASMYFTKTEMVRGFFESFSYPSYIVIPLAIAKVLGILAVLTKKSKLLTEWAYAGFFFDAVLAFTAHQMAGDGGTMLSGFAIVSIIISRVMYSKLYK